MRGRKITLPAEKRKENLVTAINRSGFTALEVFQILCDWYGFARIDLWHHRVVNNIKQSVTNSQLEDSDV